MTVHKKHRLLSPDERFKVVMNDTTERMPIYQRLFSRIIHVNAVSSVTTIVGTTIARPNSLLFGAITSFVLTFSVYLLAKNFGYRMSGSEPLFGFLAGWAIGIIYDILKYALARLATLLK